MKNLLIFLFLFCANSLCYSQNSCADCVKSLYAEIFAKPNSENVSINLVDYPCRKLRFGYDNLNDFNRCARIVDVYSYGNLLDSIVEMKVEGNTLFFRVSFDYNDKVKPASYKYNIEDVYDDNGDNLICSNDYLEFPGVINDKDGYVNIRKNRSGKSPIAGVIKSNEIFYYTPSRRSKWWKVYLHNGGKCVGYIHESKIRSYRNCPIDIKRIMEKQMTC